MALRLVESTQRGVAFVFCPSPITIDKRGSWGDNPNNLQHGPSGAFLKLSDDGLKVSHLVQPNAKNTAPVGWVTSTRPGLFDKIPIWIDEEVLEEGASIKLATLDGDITYDITAPSMICYNCDDNGAADMSDVWVQTVAELRKNYVL